MFAKKQGFFNHVILYIFFADTGQV